MGRDPGNREPLIRGVSRRRGFEPEAGSEATRLLGKRQAGNGWLECDRSSLLESAQEATLLSVAMVRIPRQSNTLAVVNGPRACAAEVVQPGGDLIEVSGRV